MIYLNRLDNSEILLNALLIERIEATPDTVVTLTTGNKVVVRQSTDEVVQKAVAYLRSLHGDGNQEADGTDGGRRNGLANIAQLGRVTG
jgi:flagellar protein FlbD